MYAAALGLAVAYHLFFSEPIKPRRSLANVTSHTDENAPPTVFENTTSKMVTGTKHVYHSERPVQAEPPTVVMRPCLEDN